MTKTTDYLFWYKSSRMGHAKKIMRVPRGTSKDEIKDMLEEWVDRVGPSSDSLVTFGYKPIRVPTRKEALRKWNVLCEKRAKIDEACETMQAILMVVKR